MVRSVIRKSVFAMLIFAVMTAGSLMILKKLPTGFIPNEDEGSIFVNVCLPDGSTLERTQRFWSRSDRFFRPPRCPDYASVAGYSMLDDTLAANGEYALLI